MAIKKLLVAAVIVFIPCVLLAQPKVMFHSEESLQLVQHPCSEQTLPIINESALIKALSCDYPQHDVLEITPIKKRVGFVQVKLLQEQKSHIFYRTVHFATGLTEKEKE